jgi:hypothetical protein
MLEISFIELLHSFPTCTTLLFVRRSSFTPDLFKGPTRQLRSNHSQHQSVSIQHLKQGYEIISEQHFSKKAITQTKSGKETVHTLLKMYLTSILKGQ